MSDWDCFRPKTRGADKPGRDRLVSLGMPHRDPFRNIGRNDPCPCGSGKKFKKCCLNGVSDGFSADYPPWESVEPRVQDR
jgi:SEC-C motif